MNLVATVAVGQWVKSAAVGPGSEWLALARLVWILLALSSAILLIVTAWQHATPFTVKSPGRTMFAMAAAVSSLAAWALYSGSLALFSSS